ncbi:MAG TPA: hypothetical protein DFS52_11930 [Myxococcales bacterium]|jgi:hypothetical protein|nr:hypothetical protein [Myxococcales bacterium]
MPQRARSSGRRDAPQPQEQEKAPAAPVAPTRDGPDKFQDGRRRAPIALDAPRPLEPVKRARMLDPRLMPLVPASVTTDPSRQFHALLGLPPTKVKPPEKPPESSKGGKADIEALLATLSPARAKVIRQIISGRNTRLRRALLAFIEDAKFARLEFEQQRRALAAFDLRR